MEILIEIAASLLIVAGIAAYYFYFFKPLTDEKNKAKHSKSSKDASETSLMEALQSDYDYLQH